MLIGTLLGLEAIVTAVLNLDTAAVFMTPIILHAARQRGCDRRPFLYGALFVANGASLLLPGSNLTNLIVLAHESLTGADFAREMALPWLAVVVVTVGFLTLMFGLGPGRGAQPPAPPVRLGTGVAAAAAATALMLVLHNPALPVLGVGIAAVALRRLRPALALHILGALFLLAVALGTLARRWHGPASLLGHLGGVGDAAVGAVSSVIVNNFPAATLLSARKPPHPLPLLIGSTSARTFSSPGRSPPISGIGPPCESGCSRRSGSRSCSVSSSCPLTMAAALGVLALTSPGAF